MFQTLVLDFFLPVVARDTAGKCLLFRNGVYNVEETELEAYATSHKLLLMLLITAPNDNEKIRGFCFCFINLVR